MLRIRASLRTDLRRLVAGHAGSRADECARPLTNPSAAICRYFSPFGGNWYYSRRAASKFSRDTINHEMFGREREIIGVDRRSAAGRDYCRDRNVVSVK